jgi:hypothetical protein
MIEVPPRPIFREWIIVRDAITTVQRILSPKSLRDRGWSSLKMERKWYPQRFDRGETNAEEMDKVITGFLFIRGPFLYDQCSGLCQ